MPSIIETEPLEPNQNDPAAPAISYNHDLMDTSITTALDDKNCLGDSQGINDLQTSISNDFDDSYLQNLQSCCQSETQPINSLKSMTSDQVAAFQYIKKKIDIKDCLFCVFITRGAGVGKTFLTKFLIDYLTISTSQLPSSL